MKPLIFRHGALCPCRDCRRKYATQWARILNDLLTKKQSNFVETFFGDSKKEDQ